MARATAKIYASAAGFLVFYVFLWWILSEPDPTVRKLSSTHARMEYYRKLAEIFGKRALNTELYYHELLEHHRTI